MKACAVSVAGLGVEPHPAEDPHPSRVWLTEDQVADVRPDPDLDDPMELILDLRFPD